MSRLVARWGLAGAVAIGAAGVALLVVPVAPSDATAPPALEEVAPAPLALPEGRVPGPRAAAVPLAAPTLAQGTRLRIARLGIDLPLEPGEIARDVDAQSTPTGAAFLLPGSAVPGAIGNAYVYAHARPGLFLTLWSVRLGDVVEIALPSGPTLRYVVTEIHSRVDPSDLRYVAPSADERLTMQTSTGPWVQSPRFVVVARPAS